MLDKITYRSASEADIAEFIRLEGDEVSAHMAAFVSPRAAEERTSHWQHVLARPDTRNHTIEADGTILGWIASFQRGSDREVTYWIDRSFWGRGIASAALAHLLTVDLVRPLFARVASDNTRSVRVLEKSGFVAVDIERAYAPTRGEEIDELIFRLD
ncbi:MAG TPA: GNAT family N-acetyltransferase [Gemmatimonadota bacterium]|nr:GNAT family N-acetyltransferase [Gemmatimonadota bacterium]